MPAQPSPRSCLYRIGGFIGLGILALLPAAPLAAQAPIPVADPAENEFRLVIMEYQQALNSGQPAALIDLFGADGVAMIQGSAAQSGSDAIRELYTGLFTSMSFALDFQIAEVRRLSPEWALVRTNSHGTVRLRLNDTAVPTHGQELFLLHQERATGWRIARYAASAVR